MKKGLFLVALLALRILGTLQVRAVHGNVKDEQSAVSDKVLRGIHKYGQLERGQPEPSNPGPRRLWQCQLKWGRYERCRPEYGLANWDPI
jgi:hypothetical protein